MSKQDIKSEALQSSSEQGHICICGSCAYDLFKMPFDFDFSRKGFIVDTDHFIDNNCCDGLVCEIGDCRNEANYTLNVEEDAS